MTEMYKFFHFVRPVGDHYKFRFQYMETLGLVFGSIKPDIFENRFFDLCMLEDMKLPEYLLPFKCKEVSQIFKAGNKLQKEIFELGFNYNTTPKYWREWDPNPA